MSVNDSISMGLQNIKRGVLIRYMICFLLLAPLCLVSTVNNHAFCWQSENCLPLSNAFHLHAISSRELPGSSHLCSTTHTWEMFGDINTSMQMIASTTTTFAEGERSKGRECFKGLCWVLGWWLHIPGFIHWSTHTALGGAWLLLRSFGFRSLQKMI